MIAEGEEELRRRGGEECRMKRLEERKLLSSVAAWSEAPAMKEEESVSWRDETGKGRTSRGRDAVYGMTGELSR